MTAELKSFLSRRKYSSVFVLTDTNTSKYCLPVLKKPDLHFTEINIPAGEENKSLPSCGLIWKTLTEHEADKRALLINLGGGMICDIGGFAASTYKRGIDFINLPTSLLAMTDAAIGGKNGIDFHGIKNQLGLIKQPKAILIDEVFLKTLPERELISGYAEICKYGLIADDELWKRLQGFTPGMNADWLPLISKSVAIKESIVSQDPYESDLRKVLNFGHTIGHALESFFLGSGKESLLHGEAVAMGMIAEAYLSHLKTGFSAQELEMIFKYLSKIFPVRKTTPSDHAALIALMLQDKKNYNGELRFVLLERIGKAAYDISCSKEEISASLDRISSQCSG